MVAGRNDGRRDAGGDVLIGVAQIAERAGVTRAAVGNWRARYPDFPRPVRADGASVFFNLREVEHWLRATNRLRSRGNVRSVLWSYADVFRSRVGELQFIGLLLSAICYLRVDQLAGTEPENWNVPATCRWDRVRKVKGLDRRLRAVARTLEPLDPALDGLLDDLGVPGGIDPDTVRSLLDVVAEAGADEGGFVGVLDQAMQSVRLTSRHRGPLPGPLAALLGRLLNACASSGAGTREDRGDRRLSWADPGCGSGALLVGAAAGAGERVAMDSDELALRAARTRGFVAGVPVTVEKVDPLEGPGDAVGRFDRVVCQPPFGPPRRTAPWPEDRWRFGPVGTAEPLAWLQLGHELLAPGGRALLVQSPMAAQVGGPGPEVRRRMVEAGAVESVIHLRDPSGRMPLALWLLRATEGGPKLPGPDGAGGEVLLIDVDPTPGPSGHPRDRTPLGGFVPAPTVADALVETIAAWRTEHTVAAAHPEVVAVAVGPDELAATSWDLTPSRYRPLEAPRPVASLEAEAEAVRAAMAEDAASLARAVAAVSTTRGSARRRTVPLGEVAEVGLVSQDVKDGDVVIAPEMGRQQVKLVAGGAGPRGLVIRAREGSGVTPAWLYLWALTPEFEHLRRQGGGRFLRSSVLARAIIPVPTRAERRAADELVASLAQLDDRVAALAESLGRYRALVAEVLYRGDD